MTYQLELPSDGNRSLYASAWEQTKRVIGEVIEEIGLKEVAFDLDESKSLIANSLAGRDHHHFRAEWLVYCSLRSKHDRLSALLPGMRGMRLVPREPLTPVQELERMKRAVAKLGAPVQAFVDSEVYADEPERKRSR